MDIDLFFFFQKYNQVIWVDMHNSSKYANAFCLWVNVPAAFI